MKQFSTFVLLIFIVFVSLFAKESKEREFDGQKIEAYKELGDFNYSQDYSRTDSFTSLFFNYLSSKIANLLGKIGFVSIPPIIFQLIILTGIIIAISLIVKLKYGTILTQNPKNFQNLPPQYFENERQDYQKLLEESLQNQHFKLAIRYLFFSTLEILEKQKKIKITQWKAPYDYLNELPEEKRLSFKKIIDLFENTWYGDYLPDKQVVDHGIQVYHQLKNA